MNYFLKSILSIVFLIALSLHLNAQLPGNMNIDQLTDQQISQLMQQYGLTGLSEAELVAKAKEKGVSDADIQKLRARMQSASPGSRGDGESGSQDQTGKRKTVPYLLPKPKADSMNGLLIYGSDIFTKENLTFEPNINIPTPRNYTIGAGDQLKLDVYGYSDKSQMLTVNPDGNARYPNIGPIKLAGLTIEEARVKLISSLSRIYPGLKAGNTNLQISLGQIRSIQVNMIGEITRPGSYTLSSLSTIANALYAAGGPTMIGSYRHIELLRAGKSMAKFDLYDYLLKGDLSQNKLLQDDDVIKVNPYIARVELNGAVKRKAIYEITKADKLTDVLQYAGGLADSANKDFIRVSRFGNQEKEVFTVSMNQAGAFSLQTGDKLYVDTIANTFKNRVQINGAVYYQGTYALSHTPTLNDLLKLAKPKEIAYTERAVLRRLGGQLMPELIGFNISDVLSGKTQIPLQREDSVYVYAVNELKEKNTIEVRGEVNKPNIFNYAKGMLVQDAVLMAGGYREGASRNMVEVARRIVDTVAGKETPGYAIILSVDISKAGAATAMQQVLEPFDIVSVRKSPGYKEQVSVSIEGEVMYPGSYAIANTTERLSDLIKRAGGFKQGAYAEGAFMLRKTFENVSGNDSVILKNKIATLKSTYTDTMKARAADSTLRDDLKMVGIRLNEVMERPGSYFDVLLQEGDIVKVPKKVETVQTFSGVYFPKKIVYRDGLTVKKIILESGGLLPGAERKKSYVMYPNGEVKTTKRFLFFRNYPEVKPGSEVYVPVKKEGKKLSTAEILAITTGLATLATMVITISNLTK
jgi:protein involved in polysaccharide export with SLBB domain